MSRAYRIRVSDSVTRIIRAEDTVCSQLEILPILPKQQMADLLAAELQKQGFAPEEATGELARTADGVTIRIETATAKVTVTAESSAEVELTEKQIGVAYDDQEQTGQEVRDTLAEKLRQGLARQEENETRQMQQAVTDRLEAALADIKQELDQAVNRATGQALKTKAGQLGQIKQIDDDLENGSMTIIVEV